MSLPNLSPRFFDEQPPDAKLFARWSAKYIWSEKIMPIYEWEGILFVGCEESPLDWPQNSFAPIKTVLVKMERLSLAQCWMSYHLSVESQTLKPAAIESPPSAKSEDLFESLLASSPKPKTVEKDFDGILQDSDPSAEVPKQEDVIEELQLLSEEDRKAPSINPTPTIEPVPTTPAPVEIKGSLAVVNDVTVGQVFKQMKSHYSKALILKREGNAVKIWKWDETFNISNASSETITLGKPSPFRIVCQTLKPYHGYLPPNEISDKFFVDFNQGIIPDHLTLTPILLDDQLLGMLLGVGDKLINQKSSLQVAEKCAIELADYFKIKPAALVAA